MTAPQYESWPWVAAITVLIALVLLVYWPGLGGSFLFDDFANLPALGRYGPVRDWDGLLRYLTSGIADPTGRPVSMLSFLLDSRGWPADPLPFKRTNVFLHAANGVLLYAVLAALGRHLELDTRTARSAALLAAALWVLHPLWASTVLYVIQRQAMLATFFVLAGVRAWLASQLAFRRGEERRGWLLAVFAVPVLGLLAGLSKMNGFLLPLLLWVLHVTALRPALPGPGRSARVTFVYVPAAALMLVLAWLGVRAASAPSARPWSVGERLMSQPRALFDYFEHLFVPGLDATGIFSDGFVLSTGWWQPASTLPAALALAALAAAGWLARARWPAVAAAVLFFLAGHAMESSVIPLELYFEHRNYLPAALLFWPIAILLVRVGTRPRLRLALAAAVVAILACTTWAQARLWGDPEAQANIWAEALPSSSRAQTHAANLDLAAGRVQRAISRLAPLAAAHPEDVQYALSLLDARCISGQVPKTEITSAAAALASAGIRNDVVNQWLGRTISPSRSAACSGLSDDTLLALASAAIQDPPGNSSTEARSRTERLRALVALRRDDCDGALEGFNRRLHMQQRPEFTHEQVAMLATHCGPPHALAHLDHYMALAARGDAPAPSAMLRLRDLIMARQEFWEHEWIRLRVVLEAEATLSPS